MSVIHIGYAGNGLELYEAQVTVPDGSYIDEIPAYVRLAESQLLEKRPNMRYDTKQATVRSSQPAFGKSTMYVSLAGTWVDPDAMENEPIELPKDVVKILRGDPEGAIEFLRDKFGGK